MSLHDLIFPHCWVCETRFTNQLPPGPAIEERHHLFPRNAGGTDGPVVSLCDTHHSKAHRIAECLQAQRPHQHYLAGECSEHARKILWVASLIVKAEALTKDDPNKKFAVSISVNADLRKVLNALKQKHGCKSYAAVYNMALAEFIKNCK